MNDSTGKCFRQGCILSPILFNILLEKIMSAREHEWHAGKVSIGGRNIINHGPVVQSIVSLTSSLRGQLVFYDFITKCTDFFKKKLEKLLHCKSFSNYFDKNSGIFETFRNFNETLTNDVGRYIDAHAEEE